MPTVRANQNGKGMRVVLREEGAIDRWVAFCLKLQQKRMELEITRPEMAERLGIQLSVFSKWERGDRCPHPFDLMRWLAELDINLSDDMDFRFKE